jgi:hypothetical protein
VVHYLVRHGENRVAEALIISAVPPLRVKTAASPDGLPKKVFDGIRHSSPPIEVLLRSADGTPTTEGGRH